MKWCPKTEKTIETRLSVSDVISKIRENTDSPRRWDLLTWLLKKKKYIGSLSENAFSLSSTLDRSRVTGTIGAAAPITQVEIKVAMAPWANGIDWGLLLGTGLFALVVVFIILKTIIAKGFTALNSSSWQVIIPLALPVLFYIMRVIALRRICARHFDYFSELLKDDTTLRR